MMWSSSPVPSWQHRVTQSDDDDTISATGNRQQLLGDMWTMTPVGQVTR